MNKQIDIKSFIIGILATICIALAMGAGQSSTPVPYGRFQLVTDQKSNAYIIDTRKGQVWTRGGNAQSSHIFYSAKMPQDEIIEKQLESLKMNSGK